MSRISAWHPSPFLRLSALLHGGAVVGAALLPDAWPWAAGTIVANQALLTTAGLLPRCALLGPNWTRLPDAAASRNDVAITIDDGPDPAVTPAVLDLLDQHGAAATFFCIGERARQHPALCRDIVRRGHAVENHSQHHRHSFAFSGYRGFLQELESAQDCLADITGTRPRFFRAPAGLRNPLLDPALHRLDLTLASWTRRGYDTRFGAADAVCGRLLRGLTAGDILLLHDGNAARTKHGRPVILDVLPRVLTAIRTAGLRPVTLRQALA